MKKNQKNPKKDPTLGTIWGTRNNKEKNYYVDKKKFHEDIVEWKKKCKEAEARGEEPPVLPDYSAKAVLNICYGLASAWNFRNYTYIDVMRDAAIENCLKALQSPKFEPDPKKSLHAYMTFVAYRCFLRVMKQEKKSSYIKHKELEHHYLDAMTQSGGENIIVEKYVDYEKAADLINTFEGDKQEKTKKKKRKSGVEKFYDEETQS